MRFLFRLVLFFGLLVAAVFLTAGRMDLPWIWATFGVYLAFVLGVSWVLPPDLKKERWKPGPGGTDRQLRWQMMPFIVGYWIVAALDVGRFHWSGQLPVPIQGLGLLGLAGSLALTGWSMKVNRFFSPVVRIQDERGHRLVTDGPYRLVRHPGYLGSVGGTVFAALAMGSWWALLPACGMLCLLLRRIRIEDRYLHEHLPGYPAYAKQVRWRVIPGVW